MLLIPQIRLKQVLQIFSIIGGVNGGVKNGNEYYWNSTNTDLSFNIYIDVGDITLDNGEIQIDARDDSSNWTRLGNLTYTISNAERIEGLKTISIPANSANNIFNDFLGGLSGGSEGKQVNFRPKVFDKAGNYLEYSVISKSLYIDEIVPTLTSNTLSSNNANEFDICRRRKCRYS